MSAGPLDAAGRPDPTTALLARTAGVRGLPAWLVVGSALLTFGYELTGFHLSLDESLAGTTSTRGWADALLGQGRWGMALVNLLLPNAVGPVVTTALGVTLSVAAWWWLTHEVLGLAAWPAALACCLAVSAPAFAIGFTFSVIALGLGLAQVLVVGFAAGLVRGTTGSRVVAVVVATLAVGVYEPFLVALALVTLIAAGATRRPDVLVAGVVAAPAGYALSVGIEPLARLATGTPASDYAGQFLDVGGFLADPFERLTAGIGDGLGPLAVTRGSFGIAAPWVWALLLVLVPLALLGLVRSRHDVRGASLRALCLAGLLGVPVLAGALTVDVPLRSLTYLPLVWIGLVAAALGTPTPDPAQVPEADVHGGRGAAARTVALAAVAALAVASQAVVANRVFAAGEPTLAHDRFLAFEVEQARARMVGDRTIPVVVASRGFAWPDSTLSPRVDNAGLSLFDGESFRAVAFLRSQGVRVGVADPAEQRRGETLLASMPVYPRPGWLAYRDGLLLVRLSDERS